MDIFYNLAKTNYTIFLENLDNFLNDLYRASIFFSIFLMLIFFILIFQKKFRKIPAIYWGILSFILVVHYLFFALWEYHVIDNLSKWLVIIASIRILTIPLIFLTFNAHLEKDYVWNMPKLKFFLPAVPVYAIFLPLLLVGSYNDINFWEDSVMPRYYFLIGQFYICIAFFYIFYKIFDEIKNAPQPGEIPGYNRLLKKSPLIGYLKYMGFFFVCHGLLIVYQLISHIVYGVMSWTFADELEQYFWLFLGLIFVFKFISYPVSLFQFDLEKQVIPREKYQGEMMNIEQAQTMIKTINAFMLEEKPYLDSNYTIKQLSKEVNISSRELSKLFNQYLNQNFNDYINNFRVEEFKKLVKDSKNSKFSILSISMDAGFRSKSTFNAAFKKFTGITPSQYYKNINN